jgi:hypothetical protein
LQVARLVRVGEIEVAQDLALEQREYHVRRVATVAALLLLVAALLGLLGGKGPFASADVATPTGDAQLTYHRFLQYSSPDELDVRFPRTAGNRASVGFSNDYLASVEIQDTSAQPESVTTSRDRTVYAFAARPGGEVTFSIQPQSIGRKHGVIYGPDGSAAGFSQWVYP